jgi:hypothetical protein
VAIVELSCDLDFLLPGNPSGRLHSHFEVNRNRLQTSTAMAITILPPVVEDVRPYEADSDDSMSMDSEEDVEMAGISRPHKRPRLGNSNIGTGIVTPGEVVTDDPQWMRWVQT